MFLPEEIIGHPIARSELEMDIKGECEKLGTVDRVTIFDQHPEGIVAVRYFEARLTDSNLSEKNCTLAVVVVCMVQLSACSQHS